MATVPTHIVDKNGRATVVHKNPDKGTDANMKRISGVPTPVVLAAVTTQDEANRQHAIEMLEIDDSMFDRHFTPEKIKENAGRIYSYMKLHGADQDSVSREALFTYASEARGEDYDVFYNKWLNSNNDNLESFTSAEVNYGQLVWDAKHSKANPGTNSDMESIVPATKRTYADMVLEGFDPNNPDDVAEWVEREFVRDNPPSSPFEVEQQEVEAMRPALDQNPRATALEMSEISEETFDEHFTPQKILDNAGNIYGYIREHGGVDDSVARETLFAYAANELGKDYKEFYDRWMAGDGD